MAKSPTYSDPEVLSQVAGLTLRARRVVEGTISGLHRSPFHGFNVEFAEYREYSPGDDLRRLDWRVFGRTDRYYIKQFEEESNLRSTIVLDASASMRYGAGPLTKFDYAATVAASLATLLVGQQDPVGLALFDSQQRKLLPPPPRRPSWCASWASWKAPSPTAPRNWARSCRAWPSRSANAG